MPRRRKVQAQSKVETTDEIRNAMIIARREMLVHIRRGYGWPGSQQAMAEHRELLDKMRAEHPDIWNTLPPPEKES